MGLSANVSMRAYTDVLHVLAFIQKHVLHKIQMKHRMGTHLVFIKASFTQHDCHPKIIGCVKP